MKNRKVNANQELDPRVHRDLIVHNMPSPSKLKAVAPRTKGIMSPSFSNYQLQKPLNNFKFFGLLIIIAGVIFIGVVVYVSYKFIIYPSAQTNPNQIVIQAPVVATSAALIATSTVEISPAPAFDLSLLSSSTAEIASSTPLININDPAAFNNTSALAIADSDSDGLNDEEETILGTSIMLADSDGDTYSDLAELNSGYNPAGSGKLAADLNLTVYKNKLFSFDLIHPKNWPVKVLNNEATVIFTAPDESLVQISIQDNPTQASILSWYEESFPNVVVAYDKLRDGATWEGIMGEDDFNFYLTDKKHNNIIVVSYIPALEQRLVYPNIFKLIINSLTIK
ncbi:MAG: hypothetical protein WC863_03145 [Patescibacteria group bacterium]